VSRKADQNVFAISPMLTMLTKFGTHRFLNKLAVKRCKRFPPHLNSVSSLPCDITETFWSLFSGHTVLLLSSLLLLLGYCYHSY